MAVTIMNIINLERVKGGYGSLERRHSLRKFGLALILERLSGSSLSLSNDLLGSDHLAVVLHLLRLVVDRLHHRHVLLGHLQ